MKLEWDKIGERYAEQGVDHGVVYPYNSQTKAYTNGAAWNGLTAFNESPSGAEATDLWADNMKYLTMRSAEQYGFTIEAYMSPEEFDSLDGTASPVEGVSIHQQGRGTFGFSCRTNIINDTASESDDGYKIHLVWGASASPSEKSHSTVNESPDGETMSWECTTTPVTLTTINPKTGKPYKATSCMTINSLKVDAAKLQALEDILYGTENEEPRLPMPDEVIALMSAQG